MQAVLFTGSECQSVRVSECQSVRALAWTDHMFRWLSFVQSSARQNPPLHDKTIQGRQQIIFFIGLLSSSANRVSRVASGVLALPLNWHRLKPTKASQCLGWCRNCTRETSTLSLHWIGHWRLFFQTVPLSLSVIEIIHYILYLSSRSLSIYCIVLTVLRWHIKDLKDLTFYLFDLRIIEYSWEQITHGDLSLSFYSFYLFLC